MDYLCMIEEIDLKVKITKRKKFLTLQKKITKNCDDDKGKGIMFFRHLKLDRTNHIYFGEIQRQWIGWLGEDIFVRLLAPFVKEGIMAFLGEEGGRWGYSFDGKGRVQLLENSDIVRDRFL